MKSQPGTARVLLAGIAWRTLGARHSGEVLLRAMAAGDEQNRMLAGMSLVKAGERSVDLIEQGLSNGLTGPEAIRLLGDLQSVRARALLERLTREAQGEMARAARDCLDALERRGQFEDEVEGE